MSDRLRCGVDRRRRDDGLSDRLEERLNDGLEDRLNDGLEGGGNHRLEGGATGVVRPSALEFDDADV